MSPFSLSTLRTRLCLLIAGLLIAGLAVGVNLATTDSARATVPPSAKFKLSSTTKWLINGGQVGDNNVDYLQTFGYAAGDIFAVTAPHECGSCLPDRIRVTRMTSAGKFLSFMWFQGFRNHGSEVAVASEGGHIYVWLAYGKKHHRGLARVPYDAGATVAPTDKVVQDRTPRGLSTSKSPQPSIDTFDTNKLVLHWLANDGMHVRAYDLADSAKNKWTQVYEVTFKNPYNQPKGATIYRQGVAVYGQFAYFYQGSPTKNDAYITSVNLNASDHKVGKHVQIGWKPNSSWHEPEGIAVLNGNSNRPMLAFGFASPGGQVDPQDLHRLQAGFVAGGCERLIGQLNSRRQCPVPMLVATAPMTRTRAASTNNRSQRVTVETRAKVRCSAVANPRESIAAANRTARRIACTSRPNSRPTPSRTHRTGLPPPPIPRARLARAMVNSSAISSGSSRNPARAP